MNIDSDLVNSPVARGWPAVTDPHRANPVRDRPLV